MLVSMGIFNVILAAWHMEQCPFVFRRVMSPPTLLCDRIMSKRRMQHETYFQRSPLHQGFVTHIVITLSKSLWQLLGGKVSRMKTHSLCQA